MPSTLGSSAKKVRRPFEDATRCSIAADKILTIGCHHQGSDLHEVQESLPQRVIANRDPHKEHHVG